MMREVNITVENKLVMEERDMNVYHHSTRSAHLISYNSSITLPLKPIIEDDYLHISIVSGPGPLAGNCTVDLPSWTNFEFSPGGDVFVTHSGSRTLLKIPPGLPNWQLRMTWSVASHMNKSSDSVTIGDDRLEYR